MSSIQRAANMDMRKLRAADSVRLKAGRMLTYDELAMSGERVERQVMRRVIRKNYIRNVRCMSLPLSIAFIVFFCVAARFHEDITNVHFMGSMLEVQADNIFNVDSVDEFWDALEGPFIDTFLVQDKENFNYSDKWGDRGLVASYNQIQGGIRFAQARKNQKPYGTPLESYDNFTRELRESWVGFCDETERKFRRADCTERYNEETGRNWTAEHSAPARRLPAMYSHMTSAFPLAPETVDKQFVWWLFPSDSLDDIQKRIAYFRNSGWLDTDTETFSIRMYIMNANLGRNRLAQVTLQFYRSFVGQLYYTADMQIAMLDQFGSGGLRVTIMFCDFLWFIALLLTTGYHVKLIVSAFKTKKLGEHMLKLFTMLEWFIILLGWSSCYAIGQFFAIGEEYILKLEPLRANGWDYASREQQKSDTEALFEIGGVASGTLERWRVVLNFYCMILMFRFFVSFSAQPKLAIVTMTLMEVMSDFLHFLLVFIPVFISYVGAACLLFGRRLSDFNTFESAFGACFRMAVESEYEWGDLSSEYFWVAAIWVWSFLFLVTLIMLNMVLALILDTYGTVRQRGKSSETVVATLYNMLVRFRNGKHWVNNVRLEHELAEHVTQNIIKRHDITKIFPDIPDVEMKLLFDECRQDMTIEAAKDLDHKNLLKMAATMIVALQKSTVNSNEMTKMEDGDATKVWVQPMKPEVEEGHNFLNSAARVKGGRMPELISRIDNPEVDDERIEDVKGQPWIGEVRDYLEIQDMWMNHTYYTMSRIMWKLNHTHQANFEESLLMADDLEGIAFL